MASVTSNLPQVQSLIRELRNVLNFDRNSVGDDLADIMAAGIQNRTLDQQKSPDGSGIPANRGRYGKRKRSKGIKVGVGLYGDEVGGEMLEFEQVRGQVAISPKEMVMTQGLDADVKAKGEWFTNGNPATGQPERPWYELDDQIIAEIGDRLEEAAIEGIVDLGGY